MLLGIGCLSNARLRRWRSRLPSRGIGLSALRVSRQTGTLPPKTPDIVVLSDDWLLYGVSSRVGSVSND